MDLLQRRLEPPTTPVRKSGNTKSMTISATSGLWVASSMRCALSCLPSGQKTIQASSKPSLSDNIRKYTKNIPKISANLLDCACRSTQHYALARPAYFKDLILPNSSWVPKELQANCKINLRYGSYSLLNVLKYFVFWIKNSQSQNLCKIAKKQFAL